MSSFMAGFATAAVLAGLIWGFRVWLTKKANDEIAQAEQLAKDAASKAVNKL